MANETTNYDPLDHPSMIISPPLDTLLDTEYYVKSGLVKQRSADDTRIKIFNRSTWKLVKIK